MNMYVGALPNAVLSLRDPASKVHDLKCDPDVFVSLDLGHKKAEVRFDDRGFKAGDYLHCMETRYSAKQMRLEGKPLVFTGLSIHFRITHIQRGYGLPTDMVVMSLERIW